MIAESEHAQVWECEEWEPASALPKGRTRKGIEVCPYVGLRLPAYPTEYSLKAAWFSKQELRSWYIKPMRRRALYNLMRRNLRNWAEWLRLDSTYTFDRELRDYQKFNDGATIGITGPKGSGKSWLSQMTLNRAVDTTPHVIFEYKDLEINIPQRGKEAVGIQVDENLKATGSDSKNLVIHVNNALDTGRKAELWVICTGINLSFEGWGDTLDIRMIPFGFNRRFQATRAAFFDVKNDLLGFCILQREHTPKDSVYYYSELGTWGEYEARARAYSLRVTRKGGATDAIDDTTQDRHVAAMKDYLKVRYLDKHIALPTDLMCRRLYRKAKLPPKSIGYMNEVIAWAKFELEDVLAARGGQGEEGQGFPVSYIEITGKGWEWLREAYFKKWKSAAWALYRVPLHKKMEWNDVAEHLKEKGDGEAVAKRVKRWLADRPDFPPTAKELGDMGENFICASLPDIWAAEIVGGSGNPDITLEVDGTRAALSIKFTEKDGKYREAEKHPEYNHAPDNAFCILVRPRLLELRLYRLLDYEQTINSNGGERLATTAGLVDRLREMIERV